MQSDDTRHAVAEPGLGSCGRIIFSVILIVVLVQFHGSCPPGVHPPTGWTTRTAVRA